MNVYRRQTGDPATAAVGIVSGVLLAMICGSILFDRLLPATRGNAEPSFDSILVQARAARIPRSVEVPDHRLAQATLDRN